MTIPQRKSQIKILEAKLSSANLKNKYALSVKIWQLKNELIKEENRNKFLNFLAQ
jgi:hypothetical protein